MFLEGARPSESDGVDSELLIASRETLLLAMDVTSGVMLRHVNDEVALFLQPSIFNTSPVSQERRRRDRDCRGY